MPYTKQQWHDDTTTAPYGPINGTRLNYIETGIETAQATAESAGGGGTAGIGTALPLVDGTASAGSGTLASAVNHVHPTDTSRAPLASPTFTGSPVLPTGTTAVTQSAGDNSTKLATTAYADAVGSAAVNQSWTYFCKTNGTAVTLYDASGASVASGTDLGALFNAHVASRQQWCFGPGDFPITTTLSIPDETYIGINLVGSGGLMNMNIQNITQTEGVTRFKYTPNSGTVLEVLKAQGVFVRDIHFQATSTTWTGTVLDFHGDYTTSPHKTTRHCGLERCTIMARKGDTTLPLLNVSTVVGFTATKCLFHGGRIHVRGVTDSTGFTATEVSDEVSFYNCRFQYNQNASYPIISNIYKNWAFNGCVFEEGASSSVGVPILIQDTGVPGGNVSFNDCFGSDWDAADTVNQAMITYNGDALAIRNFWIYLPTGQSLVKTNDTTSGIYISGLHFPNAPTTPTLVTVGSGAATDIVIQGNQVIPSGGTYLSGVTTQPPLINRTPYKTLSADTTLTHQDHNMLFGVSASGAARTITLPAATCVGFNVSVKKTDSSGNAVTVSRAGTAVIDGATTVSLASQYAATTLRSDGTNWEVIGGAPTGGGGVSLGTASPIIDGTAAAGTAAAASHEDHVHPTDTSRAPLASPTFSGTPSLPTGTTAVTQSAADNSTKLATTAYVDAKERAFLFGKAGAIGATETNAADFPFIVPFAATMKRCKVVLGAAATGAMTVQIRKASAPGTAVPSYADVTGFVATFASGSQIATFTLGTAVTTAEGDLLNFSAATGSGSNMMVEVVAT